MIRYLAIRIVQGLIALWLISVVVFLLVRASGDPLLLLVPPNASAEDFELIREALGLDRPLPEQYFIYLSRLVQGDMGTSLFSRQDVSGLLAVRLPNSLALASVSLAAGLIVAIPLGIVAAIKKDSVWDNGAKVLAFLGMATPMFLLGLLLIEVFAANLRWLPTSGSGGIQHMVLPGFVLAWAGMAPMMRLLRSSMIEVLDSEFVKFARLKGVPEFQVITHHALRNSLIPVLTFSGVYFAMMIGTAIVVETVFSWPGIGRLAYEALVQRDFPVIQGVVLTVAAVVIVVNLAIDVLYGILDPRVRASIH